MTTDSDDATELDLEPHRKSKRIVDTAPAVKRIVDTGKTERLVKPEELAKALGAKVTPKPKFVAAKPKQSGQRWTCVACGIVWKKDPGKVHTAEVPVKGSLSRVTYETHRVTRLTPPGQ
jgi:hypothetical protein